MARIELKEHNTELQGLLDLANYYPCSIYGLDDPYISSISGLFCGHFY